MARPTIERIVRQLPPWAILFFDCDGVLLESSAIKTQAFADLYAEEPASVVAEIVALHVKHGGLSRYAKFEMIHRDLLRRPLSPAESADLGRRYGELVDAGVMACPIVPGLEEVLEATAGVTRVVVSGAPQEDLDRTLHARGLHHHFDAVIGSPTEKPTAIEHWLTKEARRPEDAVLIGDAWSDWDAAQRTGVRFVGRVAPGDPDPFPPGTVVVPDLVDLLATLSDLAPTGAAGP